MNLIIQKDSAEFSAKFHFLDINSNYNLLLRRTFIHMAGDVPSTLHKIMNLVWKDAKLDIKGEGRNSCRHTLIIDEVV